MFEESRSLLLAEGLRIWQPTRLYKVWPDTQILLFSGNFYRTEILHCRQANDNTLLDLTQRRDRHNGGWKCETT
ncbi:uncharacterized protein PAC_05169 [Phialocephala subalpina]|uniref:Uncharacterized protein n=1 Tax=Phialocephala subalpina TaxID=576137 RepID=A0A1L7WR88_9HELO|nr:uncharacterized protein PAC_05169 [Phialocephala subalpina]